MAVEKFTNNGASTLSGAINNSVTSLVVTSAATCPVSGNFRILIGTELMLVTAVAGTTFTVTRAVEGTSAASHADLDAVTHILTAASIALIPTTNSTANCSGDTTFNSAGWTDVTGCSLSLAAGIWLVHGNIELRNNGAGTSTGGCKLYYGSTDLVAGEYSLAAGFNAAFTLQCIVTLASTQTVKIAGRQQGAVDFQAKQYGDYDLGAASIQGTVLNAIQLA
jgi:hypothetical protein